MKNFILMLSLIGGFALGPIVTAAAVTTADIVLTDSYWESVTGGVDVTGIGTNTVTWGSTRTTQSGYSFIPIAPLLFTVDLNEKFIIGEFIHFNSPIALGTSIIEAFMKLEFGLTIGSIPTITTFDIAVDHNETPNLDFAIFLNSSAEISFIRLNKFLRKGNLYPS